MATSNTSYDKLKALLRELFQFDRADLDFGIYRIMNQRRDEIERFLDQDLLPQVRLVLDDYSEQQLEAKRTELAQLEKQLRDAGVDPNASTKYQTLAKVMASGQTLDAVEAEVYSDLYTFFSRYYSEGDFIAQRRYKAGVYAIPYEGEEVKLHWANADQYYVKTSEDFQDYRFQLVDGRRAHFRLVEASTERDNNRVEPGKDRRFVLREDDPVAEIDGDLVIHFIYNFNRSRQAELNAQSIDQILGDPAAKVWREALCQPAGTDKTVLEKHLNAYTAKNTFDYFIHKDLGGFLRRELDFFLKNEVAHLDDIEFAAELQVDQYLARLRAIRRIGHKIIDFLAHLEDFQRKLYLKKKFVLETQYCVTLDLVPDEFLEDIASNEEQHREWIRLFKIDKIKADTTRVHGYAAPLTVEFLRENLNLVLDTKHFDDDFKYRLLAAIGNLDELTGGILVQGDNFHGLSLIQPRYAGEVKCVYVDPPYNTGPTEILYKNDYKHSSWLSLMNSRLQLTKPLLGDKSVFEIAIDDAEMVVLSQICDQLFPDRDRNMVIVNHHPQGAGGANISRTHEYALVLTPRGLDLLKGRDQGESIEERPYRRSGRGENNFRWGRWRSFFALLVDPNSKEIVGIEEPPPLGEAYPTGPTPEGLIRVYPISEDGTERVERVWRQSYLSARAAVANKGLKCSDSFTIYQIIRHQARRTTLFSNWTDRRYNAGTHGTNLIADILGDLGTFSYPKSLYTVMDLIDAATYDTDEPIVVDYFAGSGTTAHAVLELNRTDDSRVRKYVLMEMGEYFDTALLPRVLRVIYSKDWEDGTPKSRQGFSHLLKYIRLESYEDALSNVDLHHPSGPQQAALDQALALREDYVLHYMLESESTDSPSHLNLNQIANPFDYQVRTVHGGESTLKRVDLPETFNWLLGLTVERTRRIDGFLTSEGLDPQGKRTLVIWRTLSEERHSNENLEMFFKDQGYLDRPIEMAMDHIYVNGDCTLSSLKSDAHSWQVHLTEEAFRRLMFETAEGSR